MVFLSLAASLDFTLHHLKHVRVDDCFVVAFDVVLRNLALVDLRFLGQEIDRVGLLQQGVALVFLIAIDKVLMICDKDNIGSAKSIINNGGILENEFMNSDGEIEQRYWITIRN